MPPKRRRRFNGLYYHASPPKVIPMNATSNAIDKRNKRTMDDFSVKLSTIRIWMHEKDIGKLTRLLWAGQGNRLRQQASTNPKVKRFLAAVPYVMNSIKDVHQAVIDNSLETLQAKLEPPTPPALVTCRDANGLNLIHKAAGLGHATILEYVISTWPEGVNETDITGKTPLHWAASAKNNTRCYTLLTKAGCNEDALDYKMKTPAFYRHKHHDIERAFLTYVPEAPRVSPGVATDWDALTDDPGDGKKRDIRIKELNGIGRNSNTESNDNTSEAELTEEGGTSTQEEDELPHYNNKFNEMTNRITEETEEEQNNIKAAEERERDEDNGDTISNNGNFEANQDQENNNYNKNENKNTIKRSKTTYAENTETIVNDTEHLNKTGEGDNIKEHFENDANSNEENEPEKQVKQKDENEMNGKEIKDFRDDNANDINIASSGNNSHCAINEKQSEIDASDAIGVGKNGKSITEATENADETIKDKISSESSGDEGKPKNGQLDKRYSISSCNETYVIAKSEDENDKDENNSRIKKIDESAQNNDDEDSDTVEMFNINNKNLSVQNTNNSNSEKSDEDDEDLEFQKEEEEALKEYEELQKTFKTISDDEHDKGKEGKQNENHTNNENSNCAEESDNSDINFIDGKIEQVKRFSNDIKDKVEGSIKKIFTFKNNTEEEIENSVEKRTFNTEGTNQIETRELIEKQMNDMNVQCNIESDGSVNEEIIYNDKTISHRNRNVKQRNRENGENQDDNVSYNKTRTIKHKYHHHHHYQQQQQQQEQEKQKQKQHQGTSSDSEDDLIQYGKL